MTGIPNGTWILIADGEKALFLENVTDAENPHFQVRRKEEQENPSDREQSANRPGRMQEGRPGNQTSGPRSAFQDTDWHELAKVRFADDLSDILYRRAHAGDFEKIVIVAAPGVLGELRRTMHKAVLDRIVGEVPKTLTTIRWKTSKGSSDRSLKPPDSPSPHRSRHRKGKARTVWPGPLALPQPRSQISRTCAPVGTSSNSSAICRL